MKPHHILKSFRGSQDGLSAASFVAGRTELLSDALAAIAVREGWAAPVEGAVEEVTRVYLDGQRIDPEDRDTKVVVPQERKPSKNRKK